MCSRGRTSPLAILTVVLLSAGPLGCAEATRIQTYPSGSLVTVNGRQIGPGPVTFRVSRYDVPADGVFRYRVEHDGYRPAEGEFRTEPAKGRITGTVFTLGLLMLLKSPYAPPDKLDVVLEPVTPPVSQQPSQHSGNNSDPAARLRRLEDLHDQGAISDDEYRRERGKVLHGL